MREPHIFADNPLNRGEVERRDEEWINVQAADARSKFLPFRNLNVLLTDDSPPELGWVRTQQIQPLPPEAEWIFLGLLDDVAHFAVDLSRSESAADRVQDATGWHFRGLPDGRRIDVGAQHGDAVSGPRPTGLEPAARLLLDLRTCHQQGARRSGAPVSRLQRQPLPPHRSGYHHGGGGRGAGPVPAGAVSWALGTVADVLGAGRFYGSGRVHRGSGGAGSDGRSRAFGSRTCVITRRNRGRFRHP